jgi:membrane protein required for colicin V production
MLWLDIVILVALSISLIFGLWRGLINELFAIVAWICAFFAARLFSSDTADWLVNYIQSEPMILLLAWVLPFIVTFIIINLIRLAVKSMVDMVGLKPVDRLFGGVFGLGKGLLIITAVVLVIQLATSKPASELVGKSRYLPHFEALAAWFIKTLDGKFDMSVDKLLERARLPEGLTDAIVSTAAINLGLDSQQLERLRQELKLSPAQLAKQLDDPEQLEALRQYINNPQIQKLLNQPKE